LIFGEVRMRLPRARDLDSAPDDVEAVISQYPCTGQRAGLDEISERLGGVPGIPNARLSPAFGGLAAARAGGRVWVDT